MKYDIGQGEIWKQDIRGTGMGGGLVCITRRRAKAFHSMLNLIDVGVDERGTCFATSIGALVINFYEY